MSTTVIAIICFVLGFIILGVGVVQNVRTFRGRRLRRFAAMIHDQAKEEQLAE